VRLASTIFITYSLADVDRADYSTVGAEQIQVDAGPALAGVPSTIQYWRSSMKAEILMARQ